MATTRVLILGGTDFVGRAFVDEALARGHDVTTLNRRARYRPEGVTALRGDRTQPGGLDALRGAAWDIVVDTWSWGPKAVTDAAALLSDRADRYVYVSSRSVYEAPGAGADERDPLVAGDAGETGFDDYARAKAGGELGAVAGFGGRAVLLRAGLIIGPHENIGRLPWWLGRVARGGQVAAPGPAEAALQLVDARDLAAFGLSATSADLSGAYNIVGAPGRITMRELLEVCREATGSDAAFRWFGPEQIAVAGIAPWTELPFWYPPGPEFDAAHRADVSRAVAAGLKTRAIGETVADTWAWLRSIGGVAPQRPDRPPVGVPREKEESLFAGQPG